MEYKKFINLIAPKAIRILICRLLTLFLWVQFLWDPVQIFLKWDMGWNFLHPIYLIHLITLVSD